LNGYGAERLQAIVRANQYEVLSYVVRSKNVGTGHFYIFFKIKHFLLSRAKIKLPAVT
jgi:hypothetical protein